MCESAPDRRSGAGGAPPAAGSAFDFASRDPVGWLHWLTFYGRDWATLPETRRVVEELERHCLTVLCG